MSTGPFTPFPMQEVDGPPPPGDRWTQNLKPSWKAYAALVAQKPGTWFAITTEDAVWSAKGSAALRKAGCNATSRGATIYVSWG